MAVSAEMVKELRERTQAGMMDCKRALDQTGGDMEAAVRLLREQGKAQAAKKASRNAGEGLIVSYIHGGRIGVLVEVNCETDFVARNSEFQAFAREIAMQVAAGAPRYVRREDVPKEELENERQILRTQAEGSGKPEAVVEKMVDGRIGKFYERVCLMDQAYMRDPDKRVEELVTELVARVGENIQIRRFVRWELGEGAPRDAAPEEEPA